MWSGSRLEKLLVGPTLMALFVYSNRKCNTENIAHDAEYSLGVTRWRWGSTILDQLVNFTYLLLSLYRPLDSHQAIVQ